MLSVHFSKTKPSKWQNKENTVKLIHNKLWIYRQWERKSNKVHTWRNQCLLVLSSGVRRCMLNLIDIVSPWIKKVKLEWRRLSIEWNVNGRYGRYDVDMWCIVRSITVGKTGIVSTVFACPLTLDSHLIKADVFRYYSYHEYLYLHFIILLSIRSKLKRIPNSDS